MKAISVFFTVAVLLATSFIRPIFAEPEGASAAQKAARPPEPSEAFRTFVKDMRIDGVRSGPVRAIFVNKRVIRVGEIINSVLGVKLVAVNFDTETVVFEDKTGAQLSKGY
ncbi:MAG: hypothetical protein Q7S40_10260 [Opitutaceae bacterium]|nr:hypothetical protein [Opitutaceae bacterium]